MTERTCRWNGFRTNLVNHKKLELEMCGWMALKIGVLVNKGPPTLDLESEWQPEAEETPNTESRQGDLPSGR